MSVYRQKRYMDKVFIIAEAGVNHNGSVEIGRRLIDVAVEAGCDAVKFQTFKAENIAMKTAPLAKYQFNRRASRQSQFEMLKKLELSPQAHRVLFRHCAKRKIMFMSTPFDEESVEFLDNMGMRIFKIPSGEITNKPLIEKIAAKGKPVILSTGMSYLKEVESAVNWINRVWRRVKACPGLTLLHCVSSYPTGISDVNLRAIETLSSVFRLPVGFSDHTMRIEVAVAAVAIGAKVIEKHFTLDRNMDGPDHRSSFEPYELNDMVISIRNIEKAMGDGIKAPKESERDVREAARKSLVAAKEIKAGTVITREDIAVKRPGKGIPPEFIHEIIKKRARVRIKKDSLLRRSDFS